tara:strand:+ start:152 stop:517 length:366 start_codon:yes stop_codon:yes gene_type:complete
MGIIRVKNIRLYSNHGCMVEEGKIGGDYVVNVKVKTGLSKSVETDNLIDTIDYVSIYSIVKKEMSQRVKLLEVVVQKIIDRILDEHKTVQSVRVNVAKKNPPIGGEVEEVSVERKGKRKKE